MNLAFLTGLGNGALSGVTGGLDLKDRFQDRAAQRALATQMMQQGGQQAPVTLPGATPMSPQGAMPQPPMPGAPSMPAGGPPMGAAPPSGPVTSAPLPPAAPTGSPPPMAGPAPQAPQGLQPAPQAPQGLQPAPQAAPDLSQSGTANPSGSQVQDAQTTVRKLFTDLAKSQPNLDPMTAFKAVEHQVKLMQGVGGEAKLYMQQSIADARNQVMLQNQIEKSGTLLEATQAKLESAERRATELRTSMEKIQGMKGQTAEIVGAGHDTARVGSAQIGADSRVQVGQGHDQAHIQGVGMQGDTQRDVANTRADASDYGSDQRYRSYVNQEAIRQGTAPPARAVRRAPRQRQYLDQRGNPAGGASAAPAYKSAQDVTAAFQAGKLSRDQAKQVLIQNNWAR